MTEMQSHSDMLQTHLQSFGLKSFRRGQQEIIESLLAGSDTLAVLPTGGGKSLCYQLPTQVKNQLTIVVSPLVSLMRDQVQGLRQKGLRAGCLYRDQSLDEKRALFQEMNQPGPFLLYLSPERIQKQGFRPWLEQQKVGLFAIDEAHCVSQWGHDFRPEYAQLSLLKQIHPKVPTLALTASATPAVLRDIVKTLGMNSPNRQVHGFYRPNLYYQVQTCEDDNEKNRWCESAIQHFPEGRIIIYCGTRKLTEQLAVSLARKFAGVGFYHAGMGPADRAQSQQDFESLKTRILVATNAFGMGIDHPNVRCVIHYNMPSSIDALYQEMGRAGRDQQDSTCLMLYTPKDKGLQAYFIQSSDSPELIKDAKWKTLNALVAYIEGSECRHREILTYYQDSAKIKACGHCDSCDPKSHRKVNLHASLTEGIIAKLIKKKKSSSLDVLNDQDQLIFESLRDWRKQKANELDIPAFVIFGDRTLRELAVRKPFSESHLTGIYGMGQVKTERFGTDILKILKQFEGHLPK